VEQLTGEQFRATGRAGPLAVTGGDALNLSLQELLTVSLNHL
jgi:hypothetical protein